MTRYHFHTSDGGPHIDEEGTALPDDNSARIAAVRFAGEMLSDRPDMLWDGRDFRVMVVREDGSLLATVVVVAVDARLPGKE